MGWMEWMDGMPNMHKPPKSPEDQVWQINAIFIKKNGYPIEVFSGSHFFRNI
jgi:hypothetical protein